jgi:hypothetical protein
VPFASSAVTARNESATILAIREAETRAPYRDASAETRNGGLDAAGHAVAGPWSSQTWPRVSPERHHSSTYPRRSFQPRAEAPMPNTMCDSVIGAPPPPAPASSVQNSLNRPAASWHLHHW